MRKYLLPETGNFYKANLHCHSNISDGQLTPETIKGAYMAHGYSIVAYTDHDILLDHQDLTDSRFLALNGMEMEITEKAEETEGRPYRRTCHICFVALEPDNLTQFCYHRSKYAVGNTDKFRSLVKFDESKPDYNRCYTAECINDIIKTARDSGFFVTYNHPAWSCETYAQYSRYEGMHAMEICNWGCVADGFEDYNPMVYDELLRKDNRIYCIAADDNHNRRPLTSPTSDSFGAFTVIKADKLEYKSVTDALLAGNFYASQGPLIDELYLEDGKLTVKCQNARRIYINTGRRRAVMVAAEEGKALDGATFDVFPEDVYVRLTVEDFEGKHANTNAYFTDELFAR